MRFPIQAIQGAAKALWIALSFAAVPASCLAFQAAVSFRVTVQVPWATAGGGSSGGTGGGGVVCRSTGSTTSVQCGTGGGGALPITPVTPTPAPVGLPPPVAAAPAPEPVNVAPRAPEAPRPGVAATPQWQQVLAAGGWRQPSEVAGRSAAISGDPGISGIFGAVAASRMVSFGGRDYLEMTVSW
ncbi:MAG: hypothetical protein ABI907_01285 [Ramlibacter sp.]